MPDADQFGYHSDVHHLIEWTPQGTTDIDRLALVRNPKTKRSDPVTNNGKPPPQRRRILRSNALVPTEIRGSMPRTEVQTVPPPTKTTTIRTRYRVSTRPHRLWLESS
jgi:hypothetical protein